MDEKPVVGVVMGSQSDWEVMQHAVRVLKDFGVPFMTAPPETYYKMLDERLPTTTIVALNLFVVVETFYLFSCRSLAHSAWRVGFLSNRWLLGGLSLSMLLQALVAQAPALTGHQTGVGG